MKQVWEVCSCRLTDVRNAHELKSDEGGNRYEKYIFFCNAYR